MDWLGPGKEGSSSSPKRKGRQELAFFAALCAAFAFFAVEGLAAYLITTIFARRPPSLPCTARWRRSPSRVPTGLLETAKENIRLEHVVTIDPHCPRAKLRSHPVGFADVTGPHRRCQSIARVVNLITSSGSLKGIAVTTGPNISSRTTFICGFTSTSTVGSTK
jgi:hypothetical protein